MFVCLFFTAVATIQQAAIGTRFVTHCKRERWVQHPSKQQIYQLFFLDLTDVVTVEPSALFFMVRDPQRWFELARWSTLRHARRNNNGFQHRTRGPGFPSEETLEKSVFSRTFYRLRHRATRTPHKHPASLSRFLVCPRTTSRL